MKITKEFLIGIGFEVSKEYPLYTSFQHNNKKRLYCSICKYGVFSIWELHWLNDEVAREFTATNNNLTISEFYEILRLTNISL